MVTAFGKVVIIECVEDLQSVVRERVHPVRNRQIMTSYMQSSWDWVKYFEPLNVAYTGIAASATNPDVCHSKRMLKRRDLPFMELPEWEVEVAEFGDAPYGEICWTLKTTN